MHRKFGSCACHECIISGSPKTNKMFIRPTIKPRYVPVQFTSQVNRSGAICSQWVVNNYSDIVASGTSGRVGEVVDAMNRGSGYVKHAKMSDWRPPIHYEWYAKKMGLGPEFITRCEDWFKNNQFSDKVRADEMVIDSSPIIKMMKKYAKKGKPTEAGVPQPTRPPIDRMMVAWECAGYSKEQIELAVARQEFADSMLDVRQQAIDSIFGNYPSAYKSTPKNKKKVIKAVKKKMG